MRVNWFCPVPPARTDVAQYCWRILPELATAFDLTLWTSQNEWDPELERYCPVRRFDPATVIEQAEARSGLNVYHLGNNVEHHADIWEASRQIPGVAVLHDLSVLEFVAQYHLVRQASRESWIEVLRAVYGRAAVELYKEHERGLMPIGYLCMKFPFASYVCKGALGILCHSREVPSVLRLPASIPIGVADLPFRASTPHYRPTMERFAQGGPYKIVIFGYIGANRRVPKILQALAEFPEREQFTVDIFGRLFVAAEIQAEIMRLQLNERVKLHGFVEDDILDRALDEAHLAINLRYPSMGEASGSVLRSWDHALPSLVSRTRWYASLPPKAVKFVEVGNEIWDIQVHLQDFLSNPMHFGQMGEAGREVLERDHAPARYVHALEVLLTEVGLENNPVARNFIDRAVQEVRAVAVPGQEGQWIEQMAPRVAEMLPLELTQDAALTSGTSA